MKSVAVFAAFIVATVAFASDRAPGSGCTVQPCHPYPPPPPTYPYPVPPPSHPVPQPAPICSTQTTCGSCDFRPVANAYQRICTVFDCNGAVVSYHTQACSAPAPVPPTPGQGNPGQGGQNPGHGQGPTKATYITLASTYFKALPSDSQAQGAHQKCLVSAGERLAVKVLQRRNDSLIKVQLTESISGCSLFGIVGDVGFVYAPHIQLH